MEKNSHREPFVVESLTIGNVSFSTAYPDGAVFADFGGAFLPALDIRVLAYGAGWVRFSCVQGGRLVERYHSGNYGFRLGGAR